jgi:hypothetical protein
LGDEEFIELKSITNAAVKLYAVAGLTYTVEYRNSLTTDGWSRSMDVPHWT